MEVEEKQIKKVYVYLIGTVFNISIEFEME
jgi:hypothetical protein